MIWTRKFHRILGVWIALFVILQVTGGMALRLGIGSGFFYKLHTWFAGTSLAIPGAVVAVLLGVSLGTQAVTGVMMYVNLKVQQAKRKATSKASPPPQTPPARV